MIRDRAPRYTMGFGVDQNVLPSLDQRNPDIHEGHDPEGGILSKALHDHPFYRFMATAVTTTVAAGVAVNMMRHGSIKVGKTLEEGALPLIRKEWQTNAIRDVRKLRESFDAWEKASTHGSFFLREAEKDPNNPVFDVFKENLKQSMFRQARNLPYELPAFYIAQKAVGEPLFGKDPRKKPVNWHNPVDVLGDFATESVKNLAGYILPLDVGTSVVRDSWRKFLLMGNPDSAYQGSKQIMHNASVTLQAVLDNVGHDSGKILATASKYGGISTGAFASALHDSIGQQKGLVQHLHEHRRADQNQSWAKTVKSALRDKEILDIKAGPFGGMGTFATRFRQSWTEASRAATIREQVLSGQKKLSARDTQDRLGMHYRGASKITDIARSLYDFAGADHEDIHDFAFGTVGQGMMGSRYQRLLVDNLTKSGVSKREAEDFVMQMQVKNLHQLGGEKIPKTTDPFQRIGFGDNPIDLSYVKDQKEWQEELARRIAGRKPGNRIDRFLHPNRSAKFSSETADVIAQNIENVVRQTDKTFHQNYQTILEQSHAEYKEAYKQFIVPGVKSTLGTSKIPFNALDVDLSPDAAAMLMKELATHMGADATHMSDAALRTFLKSNGVDLRDVNALRAGLVDAGIVSPEYHRGGFNLFGFKPLTVDRAIDKKFFSHLDPKQQGVLQRIVDEVQVNEAGAANLGRLRVGRGVYETRSGNILDFSPMYSGFRRTANMASDQLQIPLIGLQPMNTLGYSVVRNMSEGGPIRFMPGFTNQAFLGNNNYDESLFWMGAGKGPRGRGSRARGRLFGTRTEGGDVISRGFEGTFRHVPTDAASLAGRQARYAIGDQGLFGGSEKSRFQKWFGLSTDQKTAWGAAKERWGAFRSRATGQADLTNPAVLAEKLLEPDFIKNLSTTERAMVTRGMRNLQKELSKGKISPRIISRLDDEVNAGRIKSSPFHPVVGFRSNRSVTELLKHGTEDEVMKFAELLLMEDKRTATTEVEKVLNAAQQRVWSLINQSSKTTMDSMSPKAMREAGLHRRIDEFREELKRYMILRQAVYDSKDPSGANAIVEMLQHLEIIRPRLNSQEYYEAKASILATQVDLIRASTRTGRKDYQSRTLDIANSLSVRRRSNGGTVGPSSEVRQALRDIANREHLAGQGGGTGVGVLDAALSPFKQFARRRFSVAPEYRDSYNPFGGNNNGVAIPTFGTAFAKHPVRAIGSVLGINNWSDPDAFSSASLPMGHIFQRLNRYFEPLGLAKDETNYRGGLDFYSRGLVGQTVLPIVVAAGVIGAADATLGGITNDKDRNGDRVYSPFVMGKFATLAAHTQAGIAGIMPGGKTRQQKHDEIFNGEVPVRRGRWWALGNTPWEGGRVMYHRPSWYRRFKSGYKYTDDTFGSPIERLAFYQDYSPGKFIDPYRFEKKHYEDRPYPVTGDMFTGPWGPLTSVLNATIGRLRKPQHVMHEEELQRQLGAMQPSGMYGMVAPSAGAPEDFGQTYTKVRGRPTVTMNRSAAEILSKAEVNGGTLSAVSPIQNVATGTDGQHQGSAIVLDPSSGASVGASAPQLTLIQGGGKSSGRRRGNVSLVSNSGAQTITRSDLNYENVQYAKAADDVQLINSRDISKDILHKTQVELAGSSMGPRTMTRLKMGKSQDPLIQASQFGYEMQEMSGIYGFAAGSAREALGYGRQDFSPNRPMLLDSARAYGSERSFWDMNLGGLGDAPLPWGGEFSNLEFSEITRRFIPHRRRDVTEVNPLENKLGKDHPWLPGSDYFINFHEGDPYSLISEGEMRLPGKAYERLHKLHPDATGRYGLVDKFAILGDVAPWSQQYKAVKEAIKQIDYSKNPEAADVIRQTKKQVSLQNKRVNFTPYKYSRQNLQQTEGKILGRVPDSADKYMVEGFNQPVRLAGVRARSEAAQHFMDKKLKAGTKVQLTYDANKFSPTDSRGGPVEAIVTHGRKNYSKILLESGLGNIPRGEEDALEARMNEGDIRYNLHKVGEEFAHRNTFFTNKFMRNRTAVEDWERSNVYGSSFPQWQDPIKDFLMPAVYRSMNRNPIVSAVTLGMVGTLFAAGKGPMAKAVGGFIGGMVGLGASLVSNADKYAYGERFVPLHRKKEVALEEYMDILKYVKYNRLYSEARAAAIKKEHKDPEKIAMKMAKSEKGTVPRFRVGPITAQALQFRKETQRTLYGADAWGDVMDLYQAMPKRKRDYFMSFLNAPKSDREQILSTAGRLERRVYEKRWGMKVEKKPELAEYFSKHELPNADWEGWRSDVPLETVKLKMMQHQGLDASEMGYYPQQVREANMINVGYPDMYKETDHRKVTAQLQNLLNKSGATGSVIAMPSPYPGNRVQFNMGRAA